MEPFDLAALLLRLWLGVVMLVHGANHARSIDGTASWFASKGFRQERLNALASAFLEIAVGIALVIGLVTSPAAAALAAIMVIAFGAIHRFAGFFVFARPDEGYEYVATLVVAALTLGVVGPGAVSVDSAIGLADILDGWTGLVIVAGGLVAGVLQLALFWRRPASKDHENTDTKEVNA